MNVLSPAATPEAVAESVVSARVARKMGPCQRNDGLLIDGQLKKDERAIRDSAHAFWQEKLFSRVREINHHERLTARS